MNYPQERVPLWNAIASIYQNPSPLPWALMGDFNVTRLVTEKMGGNTSWTPDMEAFNICCFDAELEDLQHIGLWFTWLNKNPDKPISRKLDSVLVNPVCLTVFPNAAAKFNPPGVSDHSPAVVRLGLPLPRLRNPFRFFNFLANHPSFGDTVEAAWLQPVDGSPLYQVCSKLKRVKAGLRSLNLSSFNNLSSRSAIARQKLFDVQTLINHQPLCPLLRDQEKQALCEFIEVSKAEESLLRQKSRIQWLAEGDQNTQFFHRVVRQRINRNKLVSLSLADGS